MTTEPRRLVVIDPDDMQQVKEAIRALSRAGLLDPSWDESVTRAKMTAALRSIAALSNPPAGEPPSDGAA